MVTAVIIIIIIIAPRVFVERIYFHFFFFFVKACSSAFQPDCRAIECCDFVLDFPTSRPATFPWVSAVFDSCATSTGENCVFTISFHRLRRKKRRKPDGPSSNAKRAGGRGDDSIESGIPDLSLPTSSSPGTTHKCVLTARRVNRANDTKHARAHAVRDE